MHAIEEDIYREAHPCKEAEEKEETLKTIFFLIVIYDYYFLRYFKG